MIKRTLLLALLMFLFGSAAQALTLDDVIYMSSSGVDDSIIIAKIDASGYVFNLTAEEVVMLWDAGVSPDVIEHMISTAAGEPKGTEAPRTYRDDRDYYYDDDYYYYDDDYVLVRRPRSSINLVFGFGYYDSWYYPYWWWHRPYYYDWGFYAGYYWPYYHWPRWNYWSPYDCCGWGWGYWHCWDDYRCHVKQGYRDHWGRGAYASGRNWGRTGHRLKPDYSVAGSKRGGYIARDGRYVFPKDKSGRYLGTHRTGYKGDVSRGYLSKRSGRGAYDRGSYYGAKRARPGADVKSKSGTYKRGRVYRTRDVKKAPTYRPSRKTKPATPRESSKPRSYKQSRGSSSGGSSRGSRSYSGSSRSGSSSSGSRSSGSSSRGSSGSRGGSKSRGSRGK